MTVASRTPSGSRHRARMHPSRPESSLAGRWTEIDGLEVFYRESPSPPDAPAMMHVHGFGLSGRYLLPTAERLGDEFHTLVPDLPGFGRSGKAPNALDVPDLAHAAARFLDALRLFGLGYSFGGFESPAVMCELRETRTAVPWTDGPVIRLHVGLEDPRDLIADLERGFEAMAG